MFENYIKGYNEANKPFLLPNKEAVVKKVNSIKLKPKGDIELKNIQYRYTDKRYIGRKQIKNYTITVYAKTQQECAEKLKQKIQEVFKTEKKAEKKIFLLGDLYDQWYLQEKEPFVASGTKNDILRAKDYFRELLCLNIKKIDKATIIKFFAKKEDNRSKEKARLYLNACLKYYYNEGLISVNPCANVKVKKSHNRKSAFTYEQQKAILEKIVGTPLYPIIITYLVTGLRKNELNFAGIENDIDLENRLLKAVNLKGRNLIKRYKVIKLSKSTINLIMSNIDIFHSTNAETTYRAFANVLKELKIEGSIVNLRHTFATNCFYLGKQDVIISREMGHSKMQLTKDVYTDVDYNLSKEKIYKLYNNLYNLE